MKLETKEKDFAVFMGIRTGRNYFEGIQLCLCELGCDRCTARKKGRNCLDDLTVNLPMDIV